MDFLKKKYQALELFRERLLKDNNTDGIVKLLLHGSVLEGSANEESDVDVLVVAFNPDSKLNRFCSDLSFEINLETGERVEPMVFSYFDYQYPTCYFLYNAKKKGKEVYSMEGKEIRLKEAESILTLSRHYLQGSKRNLEAEDFRIAVDTGYNACELCVKALLLLELEDVPKSHGGIVSKFGKVYVKSRMLKPEIGRAVNRGLDVRNKARYIPDATLTKGDAEEIIGTGERLIKICEEKL